MYLMTSTRGGISAKQIERELGVTYKTAWKICRDIRKLFAEDRTPLSGKVEMDETYFNPKPRLGEKRGSGKSPKERVVWGAVERGGRVVARHVPQASRATIFPHVKAHVLPGTIVFTDEYPAYRKLGATGYPHRRIKHAAKVYVDGDVHTQTIEGFWSLVKRGISGTYHQVSAEYLQSYLDEYVWRFNRRYKRGHGRPEPRGLFGLLLLRAASRA
jgi:transposase-like protein